MEDSDIDSQSDVIYFASTNGSLVGILQTKLDKYPDSLFSTLSKYKNFSGFSNNTFVTGCESETLDHIADFYQYGVWQINPYIQGNRLIINGIEGNFEKTCEYLGLPFDSFVDPEDDDNCFEPDVEDQDDQDDDFVVQPDKDEYDYEIDDHDWEADYEERRFCNY